MNPSIYTTAAKAKPRHMSKAKIYNSQERSPAALIRDPVLGDMDNFIESQLSKDPYLP